MEEITYKKVNVIAGIVSVPVLLKISWFIVRYTDVNVQ